MNQVGNLAPRLKLRSRLWHGGILGLLMALGTLVYAIIPVGFWKKANAAPPTFTISGVTGGTDSTQDAWLSNGLNPTIYFATLAGSTGYDIVIKDSAGVVTKCSSLNQSASPVSPSSCGLVNGTTYKVYVKALPSNLNAYNDGFSFTVDNTAPTTNTITGLTGASDAVTDIWLTGGLIPTVNWNAFTNAGSYDVTIKDSAGTTTVCATQNTTSTSYTFSGCTLSDGTAYRAYVTAKSTPGFQTTAASNNGLSFTVDNTAPGSFSITGITGGTDVVADNLLSNGLEPTVVYGNSANVYRYDLTIKDSTGTTTICSLANQTGSPSPMTCGLTDGVSYKAYVTAKSISGYLTTTASNNGYSFTVTSVMPSPAGNFRITGATGGSDTTADSWLTSGTTITANWTTSAGAQNYSVTIRNATNTADVCATVVTTGTSYTFTGCPLSDSVTYLIKVLANNAPAAATAALNSTFAFTVATPTPGSFKITGATGGTDATADDLLMNGTTVTANWEASSGATSYDVTIRNAADSADVCATQNTTGTSYTFTGCTLTSNTSYTIKVLAKNGTLTTDAYNSPFSFFVPGTLTFCPTGSSTAKALILYDSGGSSGNYVGNENCNFTVSPSPAPASIVLDFITFDSNDNSDVFTAYNGTSTGGTLLGTYKNTSTAPADLTATTNMYLTWTSGASNHAAGYHLAFRATYPAAGAFSITGVQGGSDSTVDAVLTDNSAGVTVVWSSSANAASYDVIIRDATNGKNVCAKINTASTSYNFASCTNLMLGGTYAVTIYSKNQSGVTQAASNNPFSFTYETRPGTFTITGATGGTDASADGALENGTTVTVNWSASSRHTSYDVTILANDGFTPFCPTVNVGSAITSYTFTGCTLVTSQSYKMEVVAKNAAGSTLASNSPMSFLVGLSWTPTSLTSAPVARYGHSGVWTGSELIVWGGDNGSGEYASGGRYNPTTDSWVATTLNNAPSPRIYHSAVWSNNEMIIWGGQRGTVRHNNGGRYNPSSNSWTPTVLELTRPRATDTVIWTGTEMIVWGGYDGGVYVGSGAKYNPSSDSWTAVSGTNAPSARNNASVVWTNTEMIIWGGYNGAALNTGGKYNPSSNSWTITSTGANLPSARYSHSAVWTGSEMIVWGGGTGSGNYFTSGGKYNPSTDTWTAMSMIGAATPRQSHTAVWTGSEMVVWGGYNSTAVGTGGKYNPSTDTWASSSLSLVSERRYHSSIWTGSELIVWGGRDTSYINTGLRYTPSTDTWTVTSTGTNVPSARELHTAIWTGSEMVIWGGTNGSYPAGGGKYSPATNTWTPMSTTNAPTARAYHTAIWTNTEMIVWGGLNGAPLNTGGKYNPSTDTWVATSTTNNPKGRSSHTAVWTGSEMVIWGGSGSNYLNTGGRYNPSTDSWAISVGLSLVSERQQHSAVWTGSEMIIWGGVDGTNVYSTGARYNPSTDSWTPTSMGSNLPAARKMHSSVWTGTEMIVWGGNNISNNLISSGGKYNPSSDSWTTTSTGTNVPAARNSHTAVWTGAEMIVWGGTSGANLNTGGKYNPSTDSWTTTSTGTNVPAARNSHTAVWTGTEMIVWGGTNGAYLNTGARYTPSTDSWTTTSTGTNVPAGRDRHTAVWTGTEMIVWGGSSGSYLNTGGRYNPTSNSWTATSTGTNVPSVRYWHSVIWTGSEMIVWGGTSQSSTVNSGGRYNPSSDSWTKTSEGGANLPSPRYYHGAIWTGTEMIVWGGLSENVSINTGGRYNPSTDTWTATSTGANVPSARRYPSAVWTGSEMIVWGGHNGSAPLNTGGRYNPSTDIWTATSTGANTPSARHQHTGIWTGTEMIIWGGSDLGGSVNTGSRYTPAADTWSAMSVGTANTPSARYNHSAVWTGTEMIVWGGNEINGGSYLNTGGRYNPSTDTWTATSTGANVPTARNDHSAVWTNSEMIIWGGMTGSRVNSGGRYNPATDTWTSTTVTNAPSGRSSHNSVWTGTEMIVWGGTNGTAEQNTGGRYNPSTDSWVATTIDASGAPAARYLHSAVWTGSEMVIWGGSDNTTYYNTGGKYNPTTDTWTSTSVGANVPAIRNYHTAVWTGTEMIIWGGSDNTTYYNTGGKYNPSTDSWATTSTTNAPIGRVTKGVWTGTEMIVWGGYYYSGTNYYLDNGGRYNPTTDSWVTMSNSSAPSARLVGAMVWTGTEVIVWGGYASPTYYNTGGKYNPASDSWTATSTGTNVPTGRSIFPAVWTGSKMIVWGGATSGTAETNSGGVYSP